MSVYFEGNAFIDGGRIQNTLVTSSTVSNSAIISSSLDMNLANITSVKDPILQQDAATKQYVDDLGVVISSVTLTGTSDTLISSQLKGCFVIIVSNLVLNGPSAIFNVSKNEASRQAHVVRTVASPGYLTRVLLDVTWPPNSGILLKKSGASFDGSYRIKVM